MIYVRWLHISNRHFSSVYHLVQSLAGCDTPSLAAGMFVLRAFFVIFDYPCIFVSN